MPWMDGGSAAISARISARERTFSDDLFFIAYIIVYAYRKCKRKFGGACINLSLHPRDIIPNSCACLAACVCGIIVSAMTIKEIAGSIEYRSVVNDYRDTCLWFASNVLDPKDRAQLEQVLSSIETYGDADAYRRVGRIRQWL